jgi:hypothetical protein
MSSKSQFGFFRILMLVLVLWGVLIAVGALLGPEFWTPANAPASGVANNAQVDEPGSLTRRFNILKPLLVIGVVGAFVGGWGLLMLSRQKRLARKAAERDEQLAAAKARG